MVGRKEEELGRPLGMVKVACKVVFSLTPCAVRASHRPAVLADCLRWLSAHAACFLKYLLYMHLTAAASPHPAYGYGQQRCRPTLGRACLLHRMSECVPA